MNTTGLCRHIKMAAGGNRKVTDVEEGRCTSETSLARYIFAPRAKRVSISYCWAERDINNEIAMNGRDSGAAGCKRYTGDRLAWFVLAVCDFFTGIDNDVDWQVAPQVRVYAFQVSDCTQYEYVYRTSTVCMLQYFSSSRIYSKCRRACIEYVYISGKEKFILLKQNERRKLDISTAEYRECLRGYLTSESTAVIGKKFWPIFCRK